MAKVITEQGIFDFVYRFLTKQGERAVDPATGLCEYRVRSKDGRMLCCAAGCLLSDAEAQKTGTGGTWGQVVDLGNAPERFKEHEHFIRELQVIHDNKFETFAHWQNHMQFFAALGGLTVPDV